MHFRGHDNPMHCPHGGQIVYHKGLVNRLWKSLSFSFLQSHFLHGRLGVVIVDSCHDGVYAHHRIADFHSGQMKLIAPDGHIVDPDSIVLYVGGHYRYPLWRHECFPPHCPFVNGDAPHKGASCPFERGIAGHEWVLFTNGQAGLWYFLCC